MSVLKNETSPELGIGLKAGDTLAARTLRMAVLRISLVALAGGAVSYLINHATIENAVRQQLLLSTGQTLQRESLPFREIRELEQNFLAEFKGVYADPAARQRLVRDFDLIFYRHADGSYTQRPGVFDGRPLPDGRRYAEMSATYAPDVPLDDDVKARFALSFQLSHKYGSVSKGRLFNFYGVLPEKGFPIHQAADIAEAFTYAGPEALKLETYEFYSHGFGSPRHDTFFTRMYWDYSNGAWMTTVATPDVADATGKHRILACVDVLLDDLMRRIAHPAIQGAHSTLFLADEDGTLIYHPDFMNEVKRSEGHASIRSLKLAEDLPLLESSRTLKSGEVALVENDDQLIAVGRLPETPGVLTIHYPKSLMQPTILQNLAIVIALGLLTLLVEIFIIRSVLQDQVARPLGRLMRAARQIGVSGTHLHEGDLPTESKDEIGELARDFGHMAERVERAREHLETEVQARTAELKEANLKLTAMSITDGLTGIANRRRFDEALQSEWRRAQRSGDYLILVMLDIDWFKSYNDHYGHVAGDECLRRVAQILESCAHRAGDLLARYGGEEFALIITSTNSDGALEFGQTIRSAFERAALPHSKSSLGYVTVSIGIAWMTPAEDLQPSALIKRADAALYQAKSQGRNQVCLYGV